jgi:hypothetical protein
MSVTHISEYRLDLIVDRLFKENPPRYGEQCENPVTGGHYLGGLDPVGPQKRAARLALRARAWFALHGPVDAQPLPVSYSEREDLKTGGLPHIVAWYARSLEARQYDIEEHPSFDDFARGVMASEYAPGFITEDEQLRRQLTGLGPGLYWRPPERHARTVPSYRRSKTRARASVRSPGPSGQKSGL